MVYLRQRKKHVFSDFIHFSCSGASLAQDRGRLEARIEVLTAELEAQRKQNERDQDTLKIKTKIMEDQTETIRKLKEVPGSCFFI